MRITIVSDVDEIVLSGAPETPDHVWGILKDGIDGLLGTPAVREEPIDVPQQDGCYMPSRLTQGKRVVTIRAMIKGASSIEAAQARDRICDLACRHLRLTVEDAAGVRSMDCFLTGDPEPLMVYGEQGFSFALILTCLDPLKYGTEIGYDSHGGLLIVRNGGKAATWPRVHVAGQVATLSLSHGGHTIAWRGSATGLDIDFRDLQPSSGVIVQADPFKIKPGTSQIQVTVTEGCTVSVYVKPAWR